MKKILVASTIVLFGLINAQTEKGSWVAGGSTTLGFNNVTTNVKSEGNTSDGPKVSTFNITPSIGYFVINRLAVGIDLGLTSTKREEVILDYDAYINLKYTTTNFSIMPTVSYFFKSESKLLPYLSAGAGYTSIRIKPSGSSLDAEKNGGFTWKAKGGLIYLITPSIGIDLGISFNQISTSRDYPKYIYNGFEVVENGTYEVKTKENNFGVNAGLSFFFK